MQDLILIASLLILCLPGVARAQQTLDLPGDSLDIYANEALATFGLVAVPNETASAFAIENTQGDFNTFASAQIGGGGVPKWANRPVYLEGYLGLQRYDPEFLINREEASDITLRATAVTTSAWGRARFPIDGSWIFHRPIKSLWEASLSAYPGDQAALLDIDWLARVGTGIEMDLSQSGVPIARRARLTVQYVFGDDYRGVSFGFGIGLGD